MVTKEDVPAVPDNPDRSWHQVIERPNDLAKKVPKTGGRDPERAIREADEIVKRLEAEYIDKLGQDIDRLETYGVRYRQSRDPSAVDSLFRLIHNMRGQGTTFGYPLITEIGRSFCRYVRELPNERSVTPELIDQHVDAMKVVYKRGMKGDGDAVARAVVEALSDAVSKELGR
ncbi:hypothetical protein KAJ83_01795 [Marivibrio halodurans]|uniref:HPt domain-containing protein n=1 Tax=Marivibrio halodurans TaxID=2039722 RepID=A0A8J7RWB3_9PROT|nr:hypothetical protein [Marivibrio halodurans]MBP5855725.1 hypothetical protein [Marivibrio halodurans]